MTRLDWVVTAALFGALGVLFWWVSWDAKRVSRRRERQRARGDFSE